MKCTNLEGMKICVSKLSDATYHGRVIRCITAALECEASVTAVTLKPRQKKNHMCGFGINDSRLKHILVTSVFRRFKKVLFLEIFIVIEICIRMLARLIYEKADIYIAHNFESLVLTYLASVIVKSPLIYDSNELEYGRNISSVFWAKARKKIVVHVEGFICKRIEAVVCADYFRAEDMKKVYNLKKVGVVRNVPKFVATKKSNLLKNHFAIKNNYKIILQQMLYFSSNIEIGIKAISLMNTPAALIILTTDDAETRDKINSIARRFDVQSRVYILPSIPNVELLKWISSADLAFILIENTCLSYYLAAPSRLYDAIMAGLPVVISDFPENRKVMENCRSGVLVDPTNPRDVSEAADHIFESPQKYNELRQRALTAAEHIYNWDKEKEVYYKIFNHILRPLHKSSV